MIANGENNQCNRPAPNETVTEKVIKPVIFILLVVVLTRLVLYYPINDSEGDGAGVKNQTENNNTVENVTETDANETVNDVKTKPIIPKQPSCPKSYILVILDEICTELVVKNELCTPEDFYDKKKHRNPRKPRRIPKNNEPKVPTIINYVVGVLLVMSLGAALVELYKAKKQVPRKNGKCPLSRKSSLADLTVMKHQRKELIRRESIMEVPEESPQTKLGSIPPPLERRCSFQVGPIARSFSKSDTIVTEEEVPEIVSQIATAEIRRMSVSDTRRPSILERRISTEHRMASLDGKRPSISIDDSPERRHHRLVHRH